MHIGNRAVSTLEVSSHGGTTRDPDDHVSKRSAEKRSGCYSRKLLQFARREVADEARRTAGWVPSEDSRANHQSPRARAVEFLHLLRREARAGAGCGRAFLSEKFAFKTAHQAISKIMRAQNPVSGDVARVPSCAGVAVCYSRGKDRRVSHPDDYHEVH